MPVSTQRNLKTNKTHVIKIDALRRSDQETTRIIDAENFNLPPTNWCREPSKLTERADLVDAMTLAISNSVSRQRRLVKSTHKAVMRDVAHIAKMFEFGFLKSCYKITDYSPKIFKALEKELVIGGWQHALQVTERMSSWLNNAENSEIALLVNKNGGFCEDYACKALGTNVRGKEWSITIKMIKEHPAFKKTGKSIKLRNEKDESISATSFLQLKRAVGQLADLEDGVGFSFTPFANTAPNTGREGQRTRNLKPSELGQLLLESNKWIYDHSPVILALMEELADEVKRIALLGRSRDIQYRRVERKLSTAKNAKLICARLGISTLVIARRKGQGHVTTLRDVLQALFDACFVAVAIYNQRRSDEIRGETVGLYEGAAKVFNEDLGLFEVFFYLEKHVLDYLPFFVNQTTFDSTKILSRMSVAAVELRQARGLMPTGQGKSEKDRKLSQIPQFYEGKDDFPSWFEFNAGPHGASRFFVQRALGANLDWYPASHMFRRGGACIYHYRYVDPTLQGLGIQLGYTPTNLTGVLHYVTEGSKGDTRVPISNYYPLTEEKRKKLRKEMESLQMDFENVERERFEEFVQSVISSVDNRRGSLPRLILKLWQRFLMNAKVEELNGEKAAERFKQILHSRGYTLKPFPHGDCGAPMTNIRKKGHCYDQKVEDLDRSRASSEVCNRCPLHAYKAAHLHGMRMEQKLIQERLAMLPQDSLISRKLQIDLELIKKIIVIRKCELELSDHD